MLPFSESFMFQDPLTAVMAMLLLCFVGMMVMFIFVIRSLASQSDETREAFRKQQLFLADLERQIMDLRIAVNARLGLEEDEEGEEGEDEGAGALLAKDDPLLAMLDAASKAQASHLAAGMQAARGQEAGQAPRGQEPPAPFPTTPDLFPDAFGAPKKQDALSLHADYQPPRRELRPEPLADEARDASPAPFRIAERLTLNRKPADLTLHDKPPLAKESDEAPKEDASNSPVPSVSGNEAAAVPVPAVVRLEERDEAVWAEEAGLWIRKERPEEDEGPASASDARPLNDRDDTDDADGPDYGFKVYHLGSKRREDAGADAAAGENDSAVRGLLERVGKTMTAEDPFADPDKRQNSDKLSFGRLPEPAPKPTDPNAQDQTERPADEAESGGGLFSSYNAWLSRTRERVNNVGDMLFTPLDETPPRKRLRVGPPAGEDDDKAEAAQEPQEPAPAKAASPGKTGQTTPENAAPAEAKEAAAPARSEEGRESPQLLDFGAVEMQVRPDAQGRGSLRPGLRMEAARLEPVYSPIAQAIEKAEAAAEDEEEPDAPERALADQGVEQPEDRPLNPPDAQADGQADQQSEEEESEERDAISAYASRFLDDREASTLAAIANRPQDKRLLRPKRKAIGKRIGHYHSNGDT
jgi:hypothetical protein